MTIKTKYDPQQSVWLMNENKAWNAVIESVEISVFQSTKSSVWYSFLNSRVKAIEENIYSSKEELLNSL